MGIPKENINSQFHPGEIKIGTAKQPLRLDRGLSRRTGCLFLNRHKENEPMSITAGFIYFFLALAFLVVLMRIANQLAEINKQMVSYSSWYQLLRHFSDMQKEKT